MDKKGLEDRMKKNKRSQRRKGNKAGEKIKERR